MSNNLHAPVIIIGSGPAGYSAAVYAARANLNPMIVTGVEVGGQLMTTTDVDNWPGDDQGVLGPELMERMRKHAERFGTRIENDYIEKVDFSKRPFVLTGGAGDYTADAVIIAFAALPHAHEPVNDIVHVGKIPLLRTGGIHRERLSLKFASKDEEEMREAARKFEFEKAAQLRDKARSLRAKLV